MLKLIQSGLETESYWIGKFIEFRLMPPDPNKKTFMWKVTDDNGTVIGYVKWYSGWRKYVYQPFYSIYEQVCLRDIAEFIEARTKEHKERNKAL